MKTKTIQKIEETTKCPECSSKDLNKDNYRAELVCNNCGLVIDEEIIDYSPEWRGFDSEQWKKRSRVGPPVTPLIHDKGLTTTIEWKNKDSYGKNIPHKNRAQIYRLRKWQKRIRTYRGRERNLVQALSSLDRMASSMALPRTVRETAAIIYRKAAVKSIVRGRKIEGLVAAALYAACRQCHVPRTLDEISNKSNISRKEIGRDYRYIAHVLGLKLLSTTPQDYISRFCSELKLSINVQAKTLEILKEVDRKLTSGLSPTGIAAAAIYIGALLVGEKRTQSEIAEKVGVTEVTIRNRYKDLAEKLDIDISL